MSGWIQELRVALRVLRRQKGYTGAAIIALALGVGGVTAVFSAINTILLTPLPYPDPDRLLYLRQRIPNVGSMLPFPPSLYEDFRESARGVEAVAAYDRVYFNLSGDGDPERVPGAQASSNLLSLLGVEPALGRGFLPEDERGVGPRVALISHGLWKSRFGGDPNVVGRELEVDTTVLYGPSRAIPESLTVIGVLPDFRMVWGPVDIWTPLVLAREDGYQYPYLMIVARVATDLPIEQASAELSASYQAIDYQDSLPKEDRSLELMSLPEMEVRSIRPALLLLWAASALVLLIACANVANLLLARASLRESELAMRVVMGANRARLVRLLLMESALLAGLGSVAGLGTARLLIDLIQGYGPGMIPRLAEIRLDPRVLAFTFVLSIFTILLFGLIPALRATRPDSSRAVQHARRGSTEAGGGTKLRNLLVVAETGLALLLLVSTSLIIESLSRLQQVDPGYRPENVLVVRVDLPEARYPERAQREVTIRELLHRYASLPGVLSVGAVNSLPLSNVHFSTMYRVWGREEASDDRHRAALCFVSPGYLSTMGIPLLQGRSLEERDFTDPPRVVIINQKLADEHWPGGSPLGERLADEEGTLEVIGVVGNVHRRGMDEEAEPAMYIPRLPLRSTSFVVRTATDPLGSARALEAETAAVDPRLPAYGIATLEERLDQAMLPDRFRSLLMTLFAGVALALAVVGVYGVLSYSVACRRHEMGVRVALGARRVDVVGLVLRQSLSLVSIGTVFGLFSAYVLTRFLQSLLFGVSARDPWVYTFASLVLVLVALGASWLPAQKAASVDPHHALRSL